MLHVISLAAPNPVTVIPGDLVEVVATFSYRGKAQAVPVYAGIGHFGLFGWNPVEPNENTTSVAVNSPDGFSTYQASVLIRIADNLAAGTYDVMARVEGRSETEARAEGVITVPGGSGGLGDMLTMILPLLMLGIVMPMVTGAFGENEEAAPIE